MKVKFLMCAAIGMLLVASCRKGAVETPATATTNPTLRPLSTEDPGAEEVTTLTTGSATISVFPVRGKHNTGYDAATDCAPSSWNCNSDHSNSDFIAGDHLGIDIWAAEGTPVAATVSGTITLKAWSDYSGNKVTIKTSTGWYHFFCHLKGYAAGIANGVTVTAGQIIGYVGHTGTASNGVTHLHYSLYPDGNYDNAINPWSRLKAVESNVCSTTGGTVTKVLDDFADGVGHFATQPNFSGTTVGIADNSTTEHYISGTHTHLLATLKDDASVTTPWVARILSGEGTPSKNISIGGDGKVHVWLKTTTAQSGATVQVYIDDSDGTEGSKALAINNDGEWHEYVWDLSNFGGVNVNGGNGVIDGTNVTLDAIVFKQPNTAATWSIYIDDVEWTSN